MLSLPSDMFIFGFSARSQGIETVLLCWHYWHPPASTSHSRSRLLSPHTCSPAPWLRGLASSLSIHGENPHCQQRAPARSPAALPGAGRGTGWRQGHSQGVQDEQGQTSLNKHSHGGGGGCLMLLTGTRHGRCAPHPSEPEWGTSTLPIPWPWVGGKLLNGQEASSA